MRRLRDFLQYIARFQIPVQDDVNDLRSRIKRGVRSHTDFEQGADGSFTLQTDQRRVQFEALVIRASPRDKRKGAYPSKVCGRK